jgi:phytoene dehydrogenase-like protein
VIVGGGHNGLAAAAYLARAGRSCLLLERRERLGGAAVSERPFEGLDARLSRYAYLVSLLPASVVGELGLRLNLRRRGVGSYTPDPRVAGAGGLLVDESDRAATEASFRAVTGGVQAYRRWRELAVLTRRVAETVFPTLTEPLRSRAQLQALVGDHAAWEALFERPIANTVEGLLDDELVAGVALTDALIGTFASAAQPDLLQNRCFLYHVIGRSTGEWLVPVGGIGSVSAALAAAACAAGAELRTHAEVTHIHADASGAEVEFRDDDERECTVAAGHVLANLAPAELDRVLGREPAGSPEGSQLKVNMLLARLPRLREGGAPAEQAFRGTFHANEMASQLQLAYEQASRGEIPVTPPCECYCHSLTDASVLGPALHAAGAHTLTVFALHMPARLFMHEPERAREHALAATLRSLDSLLAEPIEGCLLKDADGKPCLEAHTPLDIERELRMPGGHIFHRDLAWPFAEHEHEVGTWGVETRQERVLICGAGARRGGGVSAVPGRNAAMAILHEPGGSRAAP